MTTNIKPTIHTNGTSAEALEAQLENAGHALRAALDALGEAAPNGRDYYPQGPDAIRVAVAEHAARVAALRDVLADIEALHEHVVNGGK